MNENKIEKFKLANGLTVLVESLNQYQSVSMGLFLKKGSRDESLNEAGFSHFCEHMIFKGTPNKNKKELADLFDAMGGYLNAYTNQETICLYNRVPYYHLMDACEMMFEMFNHSVFDEKEVELERQVILNEINSIYEDPQEKIHEDIMANLFPGQALGFPVIGNVDSVGGVNRNTLYDFYEKSFCSDDLVAVFCGKVDTEKLISFVDKINFRRKSAVDAINSGSTQGDDNSFFTKMPSEQLHLIMSTSKFNLDEKLYFKSGIFNLILGESMSSILFQKIREESGLCYSIYSSISFYRTENVFEIYTSVLPKNALKIIDALNVLISDLKKNGISEDDLIKAKNQKKGEIFLNSDLVSRRMNRIAMMEMRFERIYDQEFIMDIIENTRSSDLESIIKKIFIKENFVIQGLYKNQIKLKSPEF
jgi:predicted Zn-dependent peptidase